MPKIKPSRAGRPKSAPLWEPESGLPAQRTRPSGHLVLRADGLVTRTQAGQLCGVTPEAITNWVRQQRLRVAKRDGSRPLFNLLEVARADVSTRGHGPRRGNPDPPWIIEDEPEADLTAVLQACWEQARNTLPPTESVVYYIRFGDRVKIGITENLVMRLGNLPHDEVLATEPGGRDIETERHRQFDALRIRGEWFRAESPLLEHIAALQTREPRYPSPVLPHPT